MTNIGYSGTRLPNRDLIDAVTRAESRVFRRDVRASFIAAVSVILVISGGLLMLTVELRSGWVSEHEVQMDKATAIHQLLFRR